ncbi:hypothetical protein ACO0QE_003701 [Hanseniaspora vineae]
MSLSIGSFAKNLLTRIPSRRSSTITNTLKDIPTPKELKQFLDEYIVGQDSGKKVLSVAVYNHYLRINDKKEKSDWRLKCSMLQQQIRNEKANQLKKAQTEFNEDGTMITNSSEAALGLKVLLKQYERESAKYMQDEDLELSKSNVLMVGPSGSGKTLLASTLAKLLDVPIAITDCTQLTQAGYIGEDVQVCIERLLINADYNVSRAERGIIVLDEVDKLAKTNNNAGTKDVSGEGVQQALLKILEGHPVSVNVKKPISGKNSGENSSAAQKRDENFVVDTSNILFVLTGAFVGLDKIISKRYNAIMSSESGEVTHPDDDTKNKFEIDSVKLPSGKVTSALNLVSPTDLVSYGLIPELVGRVPILTALEPLQRSDLYNILKEPKNAILNQYAYIFKQFGVELAFTASSLDDVAKLALKNGTGARGLKGIMEKLLLDVNFECPKSGVSYVLINSKTVASINEDNSKNNGFQYYKKDEVQKFIEDAMKEDLKLGESLKKKFSK